MAPHWVKHRVDSQKGEEVYSHRMSVVDQLLEHLIHIAGHPLGSDLSYYPENPADAVPERILETVKEWRAWSGLPGLLSSCLGTSYEAR